MAYTYDDFIKAANASGRMSRFADSDLEISKTNPEYGLSMLQLMKDEDEASTADAKLLATSAMEQLRKNYGADTSNYPSSFNYVKENDPNYQAFRKAYLREGERATGDALAKAAAATGGVPSSYAVTAAAQAGNYYASQLADKVPELREMARQQHESDAAKYLQSIALKLEGQQLQDQQKVDNAWKTYNATGYATPEIAAILGVQEGWAPSVQEERKQQEYTKAWNLYSTLGYATPEIAAILGVPEGVAPSVQQEQKQEQIENAWQLYNALGYATPEIAAILGVPVGMAPSVQQEQKQEQIENAWQLYNALGYATPEIAEILGVPVGMAPSVQQEQEQQKIDNAWKLYEKLGYLTPEIADVLGIRYKLPGGDNPGGDNPGGDNPGGDNPGGDLETFNDLKTIINSKGASYQEVLNLLNAAKTGRGITSEQYDDLMALAKNLYAVVGPKWEARNEQL